MSDEVQEKNTSLKIYLRLLKYTVKFWVPLVVAILGYLLNAQTEWLSAKLSKYIIDSIEHPHLADKNNIPLLVVGLALLRSVGIIIGGYFMSLVAKKVVLELRRELFDKLLTLPMNYYHLNSSGRISSKLLYNVEQVASAATDSLKVIVKDGAIVIGLLGFLLWTNWKLTLFIFLVFPPIIILFNYAAKRLTRLSSNLQNVIGDINHIANETITCFQVVKTYGGENLEKERFNKAAEDNLKYSMKMVLTTVLSSPLIQVLLAIPLAVIIWISLKETQTAGEFMAYFLAMGLLAQPIRSLSEVNEPLQRGLIAADSIFEILDLPSEIDNGSLIAEKIKGNLIFDQVSFSYDENVQAIKAISMRVSAGQTIALVGKSGAGKSSLVNLIPRFYTLTEGRILLDDNDICDFTLNSLRSQIAIVNQKVMLFDDSIANNIAYGLHRGASREDIIRAAKLAYAHEFIERLPEGYDTRVGQDGVQLSGGQRQRIVIARALLKNAPILILDEATSALDNESEFYIQKALEEVMKNRTTFVIAHRLSTIEKADVIMVMDKGQIIESGSHQELLAQAGVYKKLYERNFQDDDQEEVIAL